MNTIIDEILGDAIGNLGVAIMVRNVNAGLCITTNNEHDFVCVDTSCCDFTTMHKFVQ